MNNFKFNQINVKFFQLFLKIIFKITLTFLYSKSKFLKIFSKVLQYSQVFFKMFRNFLRIY